MSDPAAAPNEGRAPKSVLFMCGMNSIRSPMAEVIAKRLVAPGIYIQSAGVRAGERDPFVDAVLEEQGFSLGKHKPRTLEEIEDDFFDLIITLTPEAHHAALELTRSNVSNHLACLRGCGIVVAVPEGRSTRYEIADPHLTRALDALVDVVLAVDDGAECSDENCDVPLCCGAGA